MNKLVVIISVAALMLFAAFSAFGEEVVKQSETEAAETAEKPEPAKEWKNQTHCPVMGGEIDSTAYTDIQGQRVYHCCPGCSSALTKDPDKHFMETAEQGILFENIQTFCPVSGKKLEKKEAFTDYNGRRIYFCCEGCIEPFGKESQKFLAALDEKPKEDTEKQMEHEGHKKMQGHEGHGH
jgi:YHS domain-containing protein